MIGACRTLLACALATGLFLVASCSQAKPARPEAQVDGAIARAELIRITRLTCPLALIRAPDVEYDGVSVTWLQGAYWQHLSTQDLPRYAGDGRDCDEFALSYAARAKECHQGARGLALGMLHYVRADKQPHAICIGWSAGRIVYIEPQTGREIELTPLEQLSGTFVYW